MSRKFKITIGRAFWGGDETIQRLYAGHGGASLAHVFKSSSRSFTAYPYGHSIGIFKSMSAAKRYVIRQLAKPEGSK